LPRIHEWNIFFIREFVAKKHELINTKFIMFFATNSRMDFFYSWIRGKKTRAKWFTLSRKNNLFSVQRQNC